MIVGCGGSGKTVLANQLGALQELPVVHLDTLYYDEQFQPVLLPDFLTLQDAAIAGPAWIIGSPPRKPGPTGPGGIGPLRSRAWVAGPGVGSAFR